MPIYTTLISQVSRNPGRRKKKNNDGANSLRGRLADKATEFRSLPLIVSETKELELIFFQRIFRTVLANLDLLGEDKPGIPLLVFNRVICRLFKVLEVDHEFQATQYDLNNDGRVRWWEFCKFWNEERPEIRRSSWERLYMTLEDPSSSKIARLLSIFVLLAIMVSAGSFILSTMPVMQRYDDEAPKGLPQEDPPQPYPIFTVIDAVCVVLFTIEYMLRLVSSGFMRPEIINLEVLVEIVSSEEIIPRTNKLQRVLRFVCHWANLIDLFAIAPSYIGWLIAAVSPGGSAGNSPVFRLIRLLRVVRAIRLCRRMEAVIVVGTAMSRSVGAVRVLLLNVFMHMLVMGAMIFFVEQGEYRAEIDTYMRRSDSYDCTLPENLTTPYQPQCRQDWDVSPFASIPHAFWWAVVTATTTGYGDVYPTSDLGKIVACLAMVLSLCVLALPVGVIGGHFEDVYAEYDNAQQAAKERKQTEAAMKVKTLRALEPLTFSRRMLIEVYHDSRMATADNDIFLGEAEVDLELDPLEPPRPTDPAPEREVYEGPTPSTSSSAPVAHKLAIVLRPNHTKCNRPVSGIVYLTYKWEPQDPPEPGTVLFGNLVVTDVRAEHLGEIDWKLTKLADPYVVLSFYPTSALEKGELIQHTEKFNSVFEEASPSWNKIVNVSFNWHINGVKARREFERRQSRCDLGNRSKSTLVIDDESSTQFLRTLPTMQEDVRNLQGLMKPLECEVQELKSVTRSILAELGSRVPELGAESGAQKSADPAPSPQPPLANGPVGSTSPFQMPGSVPEQSGRR